MRLAYGILQTAYSKQFATARIAFENLREESVQNQGESRVPLLNPMLAALQATGPSPEIPEADRIYDWLIGSWRARAVDHLGNGSSIETQGEWHFGWVLEGRAIQDVWICPDRTKRDLHTSKLRNRYGTSLRVFHPAKKHWEVSWINPVSGARDFLVARREEGRIIQEGTDPDGNPMRWVFTDIRETSARWYGERSMDGGKTWVLEAEFFLER